jgi:ubiquitin carboxyl-terminal hydrolase 48
MKSTHPQVFTQIELNLKDKISLDESLREYLKEEILDGSNQYFCGRCQSKQDAGRFTELHTLPQTLNFQLLRFTIDFTSENFTKKKSRAMVKFPMSIDMRPYVSEDHVKPDEEYMYDLRAVLIHRGDSAYSGHYIAHVYQEDNTRWYKFNDRVVHPLDASDKRYMFDVHPKEDTLFEDPSIAEGDGASSSKKKPSGTKITSSSKPEDTCSDGKMYQSKNAYMLIYKRRSNRSPERACEPPASIMDEISTINSTHEASIAAYKHQYQEAEKQFEQLWKERHAFLQRWKYQDPLGDTYFVPTKWLLNWLDMPLEIVDKPGNIIDMTSFLCPHGHLDMDKIGLIKRISAEAGAYLTSPELDFKFDPKPLMTENAICMDCVRSKFQSAFPSYISLF